MQIDYQVLASIFNEWASQYTNVADGQWIALDGKSLKNTVSDCHRSQQNFVTIVSAFSHSRGEVLGLKVMENKKEIVFTGSKMLSNAKTLALNFMEMPPLISLS